MIRLPKARKFRRRQEISLRKKMTRGKQKLKAMKSSSVSLRTRILSKNKMK